MKELTVAISMIFIYFVTLLVAGIKVMVLSKLNTSIIRRFIENPNDITVFASFYEVCFREARGLIWYLKKSNYPLPLEKSDTTDAINDLALKSLSNLFLKESGDFQKMVHNFLDCSETSELTDEQLYKNFIHKFRKKIRQEVSNIRNDDEPTVKNFKRSFNDIINGEKYIILDKSKKNFRCALRIMPDCSRSNLPHIENEALEELAINAYNNSTTKTGWCYKIFELLSNEIQFSNWIYKYDLINAVIKVHLNVLDLHSLWHGNIAGPKSDFLENKIISATSEVLEEIRTNELVSYLEKKKIEDAQAFLVMNAINNYLSDLSSGNGHDSIPKYFIEQFPHIDNRQYLKEFKNMMDRLCLKAKEKLKEKLK